MTRSSGSNTIDAAFSSRRILPAYTKIDIGSAKQ